MPLPKLQQIPAGIAAVTDYEPFARERMSEQAWAYLAGAAADELTLADNRAAFDRLRLRSRVLTDLSGGNTRVRLFGQDFDHPIFLAPVAYQKLAHPEGELELIASQAQTPLWFQLYIQPDRDFTAALIRRAESAGYQALVVTVDAPVSGVRNREQRAGFALPPGVEAVNLRGQQPLQAHADPAAGSLLLGGPLLAAAPGWADLAWLRQQTRLPILLKGIMSGADAERALTAGVDGLVVSNHGGRSLDGLPATIEVLPEVAAVVQGRVPVLLDGGIRRGTDVLKALALGADAVLVGRPYVFGLAAAGAVGVAHVLQILRAELEVAMALTGCADLQGVGPEVIWRTSPR
jgi:4-hydroxymandelate oxidase